MVNDKVIQKFLHDLGTLTCGEADAIAYFRNSGEDPTECLAALRAMPQVHFVMTRFGTTEVSHLEMFQYSQRINHNSKPNK